MGEHQLEGRHLVVSDVDISDTGMIQSTLVHDGGEEILWFKLPPGYIPHPDLVALSHVALFGAYYGSIDYRAPVTQATQLGIKKYMRTDWTSPTFPTEMRDTGKKVSINFRGGLGSLAATALLGYKARPIATDFLPNNGAERSLVDRFLATTVETNAHTVQKSWMYTSATSILMKEFFDASNIAQATTLESTPWNFSDSFWGQTNPALFQLAGMNTVYPLVGLTEFSVAYIVAKTFPELIKDTLAAISAPGTEKYMRKVLLLESVQKRFELPLDVENFISPTMGRRIKLGNHFSADFVAAGLLAELGLERVSQWMDFPDGFLREFSSFDSSFYWKEVSGMDYGLPAPFDFEVLRKKYEYGINTYSSVDWRNFHRVIGRLRDWHSFPNSLK